MPDEAPIEKRKPGQRGKGRQIGSLSGRGRALRELEAIYLNATNIKALREAFQTAFTRNPMKFTERWIMPLITKEIAAKVFGDTIAQNGQAIHIHFEMDAGQDVTVKAIEHKEHTNGHGQLNGNGRINGAGYHAPLPPPEEAS